MDITRFTGFSNVCVNSKLASPAACVWFLRTLQEKERETSTKHLLLLLKEHIF